MIIREKEFYVNSLYYSIRSASPVDAEELAHLRVKIDGETENLDRESGEDVLDPTSFEQLIQADSQSPRNLFLISQTEDRIIGYSRCEGNNLKRLAHQVEFGVCVLKEYWGYKIGTQLLLESIAWANSSQIKKMTLKVLETNEKAIKLYQKNGFEIEGILKMDKLLSDGKFYNTIIMGRFHAESF